MPKKKIVNMRLQDEPCGSVIAFLISNYQKPTSATTKSRIADARGEILKVP